MSLMANDSQGNKELKRSNSSPVLSGETDYIGTQTGILRGGADFKGMLQWDGEHWKAGKEGQLSNLAYGPAVVVSDNGSNVSIGSTGAKADLSVTGLIQPSAGQGLNSGIRFPYDPGGGSGDTAWIQFYPRTGEKCTLEIGIANDNDDHIYLNPGSGNVGIGTIDPRAKLHVNGDVQIGSNPIKLTSVWTAFPDNSQNQAEISNDTGSYKSLMIVGNKSAGLGRRVSVWDRLEVHGSLWVNDKPVTVGEEKLRIIRGRVNKDGTIDSGSGFTVTRRAQGIYEITFNDQFLSVPTVICTAIHDSVWTYCAVHADVINETKCWIVTGVYQNTNICREEWRDFEFAAIGTIG